MRRLLSLIMLAGTLLPAEAQRTLTLDSCRAMALRNNKQLSMARMKEDMAKNTRKAMRTKYLPKVDAVGGYELLGKEISLLSDDQKTALGNIGTTMATQAGATLPTAFAALVQQGLISPTQAQVFGQIVNQFSGPLAQSLNQMGQELTKSLRTDNRSLFAGSVMVRQPVYMGGAIRAANKIADINEQLAFHSTETMVENTLYNVDHTYWMVVSLTQKAKLANNFLALVRKLDGDVQKMIKEGVATKADGLKVSVKVNEAEMTVTQAEDGLALSKMLLCQQCGLPINSDITLADENKEDMPVVRMTLDDNIQKAWNNRTELKMLQNGIDISKAATQLVRAAYLPQVAITGGYFVTNPNLYNGFQKKFAGTWNVGVMVRVPIWNWMEGAYKVRASKTATNIAQMELAEARELIELQVNQNRFKMKEANKKLAMSTKNVEKAEENLRCANLGFSEGVMQTTEVMEAQTAWLQAQTQKIDAEIDVIMSQLGLQKSLGLLN
ncbi:MAG: TolC family protein [Prevotellaceae bacterium]|nr:TolC family protein [Prevotellaceae bacterium]MDY6129837.1 TolC family protein [Prevotella sp.]